MKKSQIVLILMMLSFLLSGAFDGYFLATKGIQEASILVHGLTFAILCYFWCSFHASENGEEKRDKLAFWCFFIAPVGVPLYSFKVYGFKRGTLIVLSALIFIACAIGLYIVTAEAVFKQYS